MVERRALAWAPFIRILVPAMLITALAVGVLEPLTSQPAGAAVLVSISVSPTTASVAAGDTQQFTATGHYLTGPTQNLTDSVTWSSSSSSATISNASGSQGLATGVSTGAATITASDPSATLSGTAALVVTPAVLVGITVSPPSASVAAGDTQQFTATGVYSDTSTANLTDSVTWSSSSSSATISNASGSQGLATGVSTGAATITASDPSATLSGTAALVVTPAVLVGITVSPPSASVAAGDTQQFTATGVYSDTSTANLTDSVTWSSSSSSATISNASGSQGLATGVSTGATTITASDPSATLSGTAALVVTPAVLVGITVSPPSASVAAGDTQQFTATGVYSDTSTANLTDSVTWSSSSSSATISNASGSQGLATGVSTGAATITASDPSATLSGTAALVVTPAVLVGITVSPPSASVAAGDTQQFTATGVYSDTSTANLTDSVTWSSSSSSATISNASGSQGLATGVSTGAATITASDPSATLSGTAALVVTPAVLVGITVSPPSASVAAGDTQQFTATGVYSDTSTANLTDSVTWSSSSSSATISNASGSQGLATGVSTGAATITASDPSATLSGTAALVVTPAVLVGITVSPPSASVAAGDTQQFTATGVYSDTSTANLTDSVTWSSSSSSATISNASGSQGLATGVSTGAATITASDPSATLSGTAALVVTPAVLVGITVSPPSASVAAGDTQQFTATGVYSDTSTANLTDSVTWSSSSSSATISNASGSQGLATGVSTGAATITASDPSATLSGTSALVVTPAVLVGITVSPPSASVAAGDTQQFTATGVYSDTSTANLTDSVTWSSSSSSATISNASGSQGLATGVSTGAATITASDPSATLSGTAALVVTPAELGPSLTTTPSSGPKGTMVVVQGANFVPDQSVTVTYLSKKSSAVLCEATVALDGTFSCSGKIPTGRHSGRRGAHTIEATSSSGAGAQTSFTVTKKHRKSS